MQVLGSPQPPIESLGPGLEVVKVLIKAPLPNTAPVFSIPVPGLSVQVFGSPQPLTASPDSMLAVAETVVQPASRGLEHALVSLAVSALADPVVIPASRPPSLSVTASARESSRSLGSETHEGVATETPTKSASVASPSRARARGNEGEPELLFV